jgi:proline dehydrogenase
MAAETSLDFDNTEIAFRSRSTLALRKAQLLFKSFNTPLVTTGPRLVSLALNLRLPVTPIIKATIFDQFCGGETIADCEETVAELARFSIGAVLDYSVEGRERESDFEDTKAEMLRLITHAASDPRVPFSVFKVTGLARFDLLARIQASQNGGPALTADEKAEWQRSEERIRGICRAAAAANVRILIDAEETWIQDPIDQLALSLMQEHNRGRAIVYNTLQMYRHDRLRFLEKMHRDCRDAGVVLGAKLVRGAYMEKERAHAEKAGRASPIQPDKASTDRDYDAALRYCVSHVDSVHVFAGSHNEGSNRLLAELVVKRGLRPEDKRVEFSQLLGMSDHLTYNLAHHGFNVSKYVPYGPVRAVLPYLFRRAEENSSIKGQASRELQLIQRELCRRAGRSLPS